MSDTIAAQRMTVHDMAIIAHAAGVLRHMAAHRSRCVIVDYVNARDAQAVIRDPDDDKPLDPAKPNVITLTYRLEDAMFGGQVFVSLVCGDRAIIEPFPWNGYDALVQKAGR